MKGLLYVAALLLSLANLIAGTASLLLKHTFATHNPLQIVTDFLFQVVWFAPGRASLFRFARARDCRADTAVYRALRVRSQRDRARIRNFSLRAPARF